MPTSPMALFATLHALAALFRMQMPWIATAGDGALSAVTGWLVVGAAILVLIRPSDLRWLLLLCATQLLDVAVLAPMVPNHWTLTVLVNLTLLLTVGQLAWADRRLPSATELWSALATPMRWGIAIFYLFTGFWKLNSDFLRPEVSCGSAAWHRLQDQFFFLPGGTAVEHGVMGATLVLEWVGPVLLLIPRTRRATALVFVGFHCLLGLDILQNFQNFSNVMFALLVFYLDDEAVERGTKRVSPVMLSRVWAVVWAVFSLLIWVGLLLVTPEQVNGVFTLVRWLLFVILQLPVVAFVFLGAQTAGESSPLPRGRMAWIFLALVVLNGISPYVGLKTRSSWQMYSNLRLDPQGSNHFLLGPSLDLLGLQRETVTVEQVSDPELQERWADVQVTLYMLRWHAHRSPELAITYTRNGERREVVRAGEDPELVAPPWPIRKLAWFRPVGEKVGERCVW